jgi:hypothetical protein
MAMSRRPAPTTAPPAPPAGTIEGTRYYLGVMIATLKDCGHRPEHVRQAMRELLSPGTAESIQQAEAELLEMHRAGNVDDILEAAAHLERSRHASGVQGDSNGVREAGKC